MIAGLAFLAAATLLARGGDSSLRARLAAAAQKVYDDWDENEDEYAGGGICHLIADAMVDVLSAAGIEAQSVSAAVGEVHVFVVAKADDGVFSIDIPPGTYETGGGYTWKKIPGVTIDARDVLVDRLSADPDDFDQFTEDG